MSRPRWMLQAEASTWRSLMSIGMALHKTAYPRPPEPYFYKHITSTLSLKPGKIGLAFYVPAGYAAQYQARMRRRARRGIPVQGENEYLWETLLYNAELDSTAHSGDGGGGIAMPTLNGEFNTPLNSATNSPLPSPSPSGASTPGTPGGAGPRYPVLVNFHGGGFTLGTSTDDARWCAAVTSACNAVVISVDYRLAPSFPFPVSIEDGADVILWIHQNAASVLLDPNKIALSGFSSGGNLVFSVPLLVEEALRKQRAEELARTRSDPASRVDGKETPTVSILSMSASASSLPGLRQKKSSEPLSRMTTASTLAPPQLLPNLSRVSTISDTGSQALLNLTPGPATCCLLSFYPRVDFSCGRGPSVAISNPRPSDGGVDVTGPVSTDPVIRRKSLSPMFTTLFDQSYLSSLSPEGLKTNYFLSPLLAPTERLKEDLPADIGIYTAELDILTDQTEIFRDKLMNLNIDLPTRSGELPADLPSPELEEARDSFAELTIDGAQIESKVWHKKNLRYSMIKGVPHGWDKNPNPLWPDEKADAMYKDACKVLNDAFAAR